MGFLDALNAYQTAAFAPETFGSTVPPGVVSDGQADRWHDAGAGMLADALGYLGLRRKFRQSETTPLDGRNVASHLILTGRLALRGATERLVSGGSTLAGWAREVRDAAMPRHYAATMALVGSPELAPADRLAVREAVAGHVGLLRRFRNQLATAAQKLDGSAVSRAMLYASAAWATAMNAWRGKMQRDGFTEEKWVLSLDAGHTCAGCRFQASRGWVSQGELPPLGSQICKSGCRCWISVR